MAGQGTNNLTRELANHRAAELVEDGRKDIITCSACGKELIEIWMIRPNAPLVSEIIVDCPWCGDASFQKTITGQYCIGHIQDSGVLMTKTPTEVETTAEGKLLQKVRIQTTKRE